jgi:protein-tyrosine phosphatase/nicotinamidase-related amidase
VSSILITDCLQHDFVGPIGRFDALPNALHVGHDESLRLLGAEPREGPLARTVAWAHAQPDEIVRVFHVRDWHDPADPVQRNHLLQFGSHCVKGSPGAEFVFPLTDLRAGKKVEIVDATTLSDFIGADLGRVLDPHAGQAVRVGLMGVWTEAKIMFLAYELRSRYPQFQLAVCSALTASSSRQHHFLALDQMERIIGVQVLPSVGEFVDFLGGRIDDAPLIGFSEKHPSLAIADGTRLSDVDTQLVRYLFRGCREVSVRSLDGGFSGNAVLGAHSINMHGQEQAPHVVKIGQRAAIGQERESFERIEEVLGNSAPQVADFADLSDRGAIKYRYAAFGSGTSRSFQKLYEEGIPIAEVTRILDAVFEQQLGRLYRAAELERSDLLEYYQFSDRWTSSVKANVESIAPEMSASDVLEFPGGRRVASIVQFYEKTLPTLSRVPRSHYYADLHGDLNGANIIVDSQRNVWLIDFFHSHRGHVLKDLIKLENDVLYIFTKIDGEDELEQALTLTDLILSVEDLGRPLPEMDGAAIRSDRLLRAYETVRTLRGYYPAVVHADRDPAQVLTGIVRYAVHTLGFDECSLLQKRWALYTACSAAAQLRRRLTSGTNLRIDWLPPAHASPGKVGLTWLPGRRDAGRSIEDDLRMITEQGVKAVLCLLTRDEFHRYGVDDLLERYAAAGLDVLHLPVVDGAVPSSAELTEAVRWIDAHRTDGRHVLLHCVGGLGRAGTVAAAWLKARGLDADAAIAIVRAARSARAIETRVQEEAVERFSLPPSRQTPIDSRRM